MNEVWKWLIFKEKGKLYNYYGKYMISNSGKIKSVNYRHTGKEQILKIINRNNYSYITLCKNGKTKQFCIHRLVAYIFLKNPNNLTEVNHIDENKNNNHVLNLEWVTHKKNCNYGTRNERISEKRKDKPLSEEHKRNMSKNHARATAKKVIQLNFKNEIIDIYDSAKEASEKMNFNYHTFRGYLQGNRKTHEYKDFLWYYLDNFISD